MKGDDAAGGNRNLLAGFRIAPRPLRLVAQLKISKSGKLYALPVLQCQADFLEKRLHHVLGLAFVETHFFK